MKTIDKEILDYLRDNNPDKLDSFITSPLQIIESEVLSDDHILMDEAHIIMDLFNSYNKDLLNPENEEFLLEIPETSPLYSFRCGVLAIKEFYNENQPGVVEYLNEVRENSPVKKLCNYILKGKETALFTQDKILNSSIDALKEAIDNSLTDIYPAAVKMLLDDLKEYREEDVENAVLTIIEESLDTIPLEVIHKSLVPRLPLCESARLMALGTMYRYPVKSLGYLFSYTNLSEFNDPDNNNFKALLIIIKDIVKALIQEKYKFTCKEEKEQFIKESEIFIHLLENLYNIEYKYSQNPLTNLKRALDIKITNIEKRENRTDIKQGELL